MVIAKHGNIIKHCTGNLMKKSADITMHGRPEISYISNISLRNTLPINILPRTWWKRALTSQCADVRKYFTEKYFAEIFSWEIFCREMFCQKIFCQEISYPELDEKGRWHHNARTSGKGGNASTWGGNVCFLISYTSLLPTQPTYFVEIFSILGEIFHAYIFCFKSGILVQLNCFHFVWYCSSKEPRRDTKSQNFPVGRISCAETFRTKRVDRFRDKNAPKVRK